jgi:hypothetical protein
VRDLDSLAARPLAGTEGAVAFRLFWSPDSRWIGFVSGEKLKKIGVAGGPALPICDAGSFQGSGSWVKDYIVFGSLRGILRVLVSGGEPTIVAAPAKGFGVVAGRESSAANPWFLPDGRHFLYGTGSPGSQQTVIYAGDVEAKDPSANGRKVLDGTPSIAYSQGYILFLSDRTLMAQRFDTGSLQTQGDAASVAEQVGTSGAWSAFTAFRRMACWRIPRLV